MLVATALCADRAMAAAPVVNQQIVSVAGRVVNRLASQFRRTVPAFRTVPVRSECGVVQVASRRLPESERWIAPVELSPYQFRLPPPIA